MNNRLTRRTFLGTSMSAVGASVIASGALAAEDTTRESPNQRLNVGIIGCGGRGRYLQYIAQITPGMHVKAVCDVHQGHLAEALKQVDGKADSHGDLRKLLDDKDIDAVVVATTTHWHTPAAVLACQAGKDVYIEKPVGVTVAECQAAVKAARKYNRIMQMGTQQRSWEHYARAVEIIQSGRLGEISQVHVWDLENFTPGFGSPPDGPPPPELDWDMYLGPAPRVPYNPNRYLRHYWFYDYDGAWQVAWGVHHYDIVNWAMGVTMPISAGGSGAHVAFEDNTEWPDTYNGTALYGPGPVAKRGFLLTYTLRSNCSRPIEKRGHGKAFYGSEGMLALDRTGFELWTSSQNGKQRITEEVSSAKSEHEVVQDHMKGFLECVNSRKVPFADIQRGYEATLPGLLMNVGFRLGREVKWDPEKERFIGDDQANAMLSRDNRAPWKIEV